MRKRWKIVWQQGIFIYRFRGSVEVGYELTEHWELIRWPRWMDVSE